MFDMLELVKEKMNFTFTLIDSIDGSIGKEENGSWTGITGMLCRKEADFSIAGLASEPNQVYGL